MLNRSRSRYNGRDLPATFLQEMAFYGATDAWDFVNQSYLRAGRVTAPDLTFTRASAGYAETSDGRLVEFASGVPRITDRGFLIEGARTNLLLRSQEFNAAWTMVNATVGVNAVLAPDNTLTADGIIENATPSVVHRPQGSTPSSLTSGVSYTASVWVKRANVDFFNIGLSGGVFGATAGAGPYFNIANGTVHSTPAGTTARIEAYANGWYRCIYTAEATASAVTQIFLHPTTSNSSAAYTGVDGRTSAYLWGAQLEASSFATSYVKTEGTAVTRAADNAYATGFSNSGAQTLFAETGTKTNTGGPVVVWFANGLAGTDNRILIFRASLDSEARAFMASGGSVQAQQNFGTWTGDPQKFAARFDTDNVRGAVGGTLGTADTTATLPAAALDTFAFGGDGSTTSMFGYLRRVATIPRSLSDAQLQEITT